MQIVESFGKNIFVGDQMIGYIDREGIFINRHKFADVTPDGVISYNQQKIGYVDEDGYIIVKGKEAILIQIIILCSIASVASSNIYDCNWY